VKLDRRIAWLLPGVILLVTLSGVAAQEEEKIAADSTAADSVIVDTSLIAVDTTKVVEDVHPQDIEVTGFEVDVIGYVRVNMFYDVQGMRNTEGFRPIEIPVGREDSEEFKGLYLGARQSRIGVESTVGTRVGRLRTYIEGDFVGAQASLAFRLRHAFGQAGYWTAGQTWSTAMDLEALPKTVDFDGPNSSVLVRQGLVRFERRFGEPYIWAIGIENPKPEITYTVDTLVTSDRQTSFDVTTRFKRLHPRGHVQLSGIFRMIGYTDLNKQKQLEPGGGGVLSLKINTHRDGKFLMQGIWGLGISRYINGLQGANLDGVLLPDGTFKLFEVMGGYLSYQWNWNRSGSLNSTVVIGNTRILNGGDMPPEFYKRGGYGSFDAFWRTFKSFEVGFGVTVGRRMNNDGAVGDATRIGAVGKFTF
jgi:drug/metabolite transporter superfamily protein YnfA